MKLEDDAIADLLTKAARKEAKRKKKEAKLLKRKLEGVAKARRREEQAARERAKAAEYAAERGQLPPPDVHIKPASFAVDAPPPRDEGDLRWLFAMDHERDAKRAARKARATAAPSKQAASFEMLRDDSDDDAAPPVPPPLPPPPVVAIAPPTFSLQGQDFDDI